MRYALLTALLVGCATQPKPKLDELLAPCAIAEPKEHSAKEAVRVANARRAALIKCNDDKAKLRERLK
jgi:hypothetical protein